MQLSSFNTNMLYANTLFPLDYLMTLNIIYLCTKINRLLLAE